MPLIRRTFPVGVLGCNCTILACPDTHQALVIDPGDDADAILADLARDGLTAVKLLHTHAHFDHVMGTADVAAATGAEVMLHRDDRWLYDRTLMQIEAFGGFRRPDGQPWHPPPPPTRELTGDEALSFGRREARALHTPGHTPGSTCFYVERAQTPAAGSAARGPPAAGRGHPVRRVDRADRPVGRVPGDNPAVDPRAAVHATRRNACHSGPRAPDDHRCRA